MIRWKGDSRQDRGNEAFASRHRLLVGNPFVIPAERHGADKLLILPAPEVIRLDGGQHGGEKIATGHVLLGSPGILVEDFEHQRLESRVLCYAGPKSRQVMKWRTTAGS